MTTTKQAHLNVFESSLYDTRNKAFVPLRENYSKHHKRIGCTQDLKASLRAGPYCWPGGYEIVYLTSDGALLCSKCVKKHVRTALWSMRNNCNDGWKVVGTAYEAVSPDCSAEDTTSYCDHCSREFGELA